jgi:hypothetical protein
VTGREASVSARLKLAADRKGVTFQYVTLLYMHEGFLRRLSASSHRGHFVLKGGLLLQCLSESSARTTKDIDLLGQGITNNTAEIKAAVIAIVSIQEDDALRFDQSSLEVEDITEGNEYHGVRIRITCFLGNIRNTIQVDIGFGDAVESPLQELDYPILVDGRAFSLLSYPLSTVIAEKFEAMVALADLNSRMKDFWDIAYLLENYTIADKELLDALNATFQKRGTARPVEPIVFSPSFAHSEAALKRWKAFIKRTHLPDSGWNMILEVIRDRLRPLYKAMSK